jgi:uncharacterized coiled-coil DUF342 family protein
MRRGYDPGYGSREQLRACHEHGMIVARERDKLKAENEQLNHAIEQVNAINTELNWTIQQLANEIEQLKIDLESANRSVWRSDGQIAVYESTICPHCGEGVFQ